jgi:hypothetical protein
MLTICRSCSHAEDPRRESRRDEGLERVDFLAGADELDRQAGDLAHGQGDTAARVAVGLRQDDARQRQRFVKRPRRVHGVLSRHRIDDEQRLAGAHERVQLARLAHHLRVDVQAARGVEDQPALAAALRRGKRVARDLRRGAALALEETDA